MSSAPAKPAARRTAHVFCIARELLEGLVLDHNANFLAGRLSGLGYRVASIQVLDDLEEEIAPALERALATKPAVIVTTGGLGPGNTDVTRDGVARALRLPLCLDESAKEMLARSYRRLFAKGIVDDPALHEERLRMARVPEGAKCFENPIGTAPAVLVGVGETLLFMLPGTPEEMQRLFDLCVVPTVVGEGPGTRKKARHIAYQGRDESAIVRMLRDLNRRHHGIHSRARTEGTSENIVIRITLFGEHSDEQELDALLDRAEADLRARLGLEVQGSLFGGDHSE
jgi:molybdenum cofactor synthesis domain-containing protein